MVASPLPPMRRAALLLLAALALTGCRDDPWVRLNFGADNMRSVPGRSLQVAETGPWVAATLRPADADLFTSVPFSILLNREDSRPTRRPSATGSRARSSSRA